MSYVCRSKPKLTRMYKTQCLWNWCCWGIFRPNLLLQKMHNAETWNHKSIPHKIKCVHNSRFLPFFFFISVYSVQFSHGYKKFCFLSIGGHVIRLIYHANELYYNVHNIRHWTMLHYYKLMIMTKSNQL